MQGVTVEEANRGITHAIGGSAMRKWLVVFASICLMESACVGSAVPPLR
jgi:hypothetical protein